MRTIRRMAGQYNARMNPPSAELAGHFREDIRPTRSDKPAVAAHWLIAELSRELVARRSA